MTGQRTGAMLWTSDAAAVRGPFAIERHVYSKWRHGGWYVETVQYPGGGTGTVSRNYADGKWRIVGQANSYATLEESPTYPSRDAAADAEAVWAWREENVRAAIVEQKRQHEIALANAGSGTRRELHYENVAARHADRIEALEAYLAKHYPTKEEVTAMRPAGPEILVERPYLVTYTVTVDARDADEAILRANDSHGGGHWEAVRAPEPCTVAEPRPTAPSTDAGEEISHPVCEICNEIIEVNDIEEMHSDDSGIYHRAGYERLISAEAARYALPALRGMARDAQMTREDIEDAYADDPAKRMDMLGRL